MSPSSWWTLKRPSTAWVGGQQSIKCLFYLICEVLLSLFLKSLVYLSVLLILFPSSLHTHTHTHTGDWRLSCRTNPLVIPVNHDLSMAFYHTKAILVMFRSSLVAISGVGLRSFQFFDPITISSCQSNEIYNPMGQRWGLCVCVEGGSWWTEEHKQMVKAYIYTDFTLHCN